MSLVNNIKNKPVVNDFSAQTVSATPPTVTYSGGLSGGTYRRKYSVKLADIQGLGAFTTGDVILDVLPAGSIVTTSRIKHSTAVVGATGPITAATARLMFGATALNAAALDVFAAVNTTDSTTVTGLTNVISPNALDATTNLVMRVTQTGATTGFTDVTAGQIDAWVDFKVML